MEVSVKPGKYIVAVSGGVDSMVLLDVLARRPDLELVVAHFEHGIREDSDRDRQLVEQVAQRHDLPFVFEQGNLGPGASEARAREARYAFLRRVKKNEQARAIITAHHKDDVIETAILNMLRGTGRKGLSSLTSTDDILRPFLGVTKHEIYAYAVTRPEIIWHEDSTNEDDHYLRNYVRRHIVGPMSIATRDLFLEYLAKAHEANMIIDQELLHHINEHSQNGELDRAWFTLLPYDVSREVMAAWLRHHSIRDFDRKTIERLVVNAKVAMPGKQFNINAAYWLETAQTILRITPRNDS